MTALPFAEVPFAQIPFAEVKRLATAQGITALACIAVPATLPSAGFDRLKADGVGDMAWLTRTRELRLSPADFAPWAKRIIIAALAYEPHLETTQLRRARYAAGKDYHSIFRNKLANLGRAMDQHSGTAMTHRACVDSAPVNERTLAQLAAVGWIGRNALLINPTRGSYRFLGELFTSTDVAIHLAEHGADRCGSCRRCEERCPTQALRGRQVLSERCISYLTIEHHGVIARELAAQFQGWWFGCDLCQEVCPWNRFAPPADDSRLRGHDDPEKLLQITAADFDQHFAGRAIRRIGYERFRRNLLIATWSVADHASAAHIAHTSRELPLVQAQAVELGMELPS